MERWIRATTPTLQVNFFKIYYRPIVGACTEENLSCGEDEETVVNNPLSIFNEEEEDDFQEGDRLSEPEQIFYGESASVPGLELFPDPTGVSDDEEDMAHEFQKVLNVSEKPKEAVKYVKKSSCSSTISSASLDL